MGTTKETQQTGQFNPQGMGAYNQVTPAFGQQATSFINKPYGNPQFQFESQMGQSNANQQNQNNVNQLFQNQQASGFGGGAQSPFMQEMLANQMRAGTQNSALQGFINPTMLANQRQMGSMGMASQFRPLQTGQTNVESTHGLGTWLPQVASFGLGAAMAPFTGGASMMGGVPQSPSGGGMSDPSGGQPFGSLGQAMGWGGTPPGMSNNFFNPGGISGMQGGVPGGTGGISPWMGTPGIVPGGSYGGGMMPWMQQS